MAVHAVVVAGPTASGKTGLALHLAEALGGEIVSFDSVQLYRDFDIGSAKPTPAERARVPHHFIGEADPRRPWSAGEYARRARPRLLEIAARGRVVVLVGGTGFYWRALSAGLSEAPTAPPALRARLQARLARQGPERLHAVLGRLDAASAQRIARRDGARIVRALEVRLLAGRPVGEVWRASAPQAMPGLRALRLGLAPPRAALQARIDARAAAMFAPPGGAGGIVEETRQLLASYPHDLWHFKAHGYKQAVDILLRGADPGRALAEAQQEQRHYAKRQGTWFRRDPEMHWLQGFGEAAAVRSAGLELARAFLAADPADPGGASG